MQPAVSARSAPALLALYRRGVEGPHKTAANLQPSEQHEEQVPLSSCMRAGCAYKSVRPKQLEHSLK